MNIDEQFAQWLAQQFGAPFRGVANPDVTRLQAYWANLDPAEKTSVFGQLRKVAGDSQKLGTLIDQLTTGKVPAVPPQTTQQVQTAKQNTVQQQAVTAATPTTAQLPEQTVGNVAPGILTPPDDAGCATPPPWPC